MKKKNNFFDNKIILITGGTGSFGSFYANYLFKKYKKIKKIIILSRDELKQFNLSKKLKDKKFRFFLGDIRDKDRLKLAFSNVDIVIHTAALKQVPTAEYNPFEFVQTNVVGTQNVIEACIDKKVKNLVSLSTDKAVSPLNLYGSTKLAADKLVCAANNMIGDNKYKFSVVRYGNVLGSRGSILDYFLEFKNKGYFPVTDKRMTRFNITLNEAAALVDVAIQNASGGEIFIPKIPSIRVIDMAAAINSKCKIKIIGIRPGEKIHEEMISSADSMWVKDLKKYYVLLNSSNKRLLDYYKGFKKMKQSSYNSRENKFLSIKQIKSLINKERNNILKS